ncbi:hypothetical protein Verru16b_02752 [Lacunisphaera limnophila]|uniref:Uncharacterized protein n=1 Tax=Lacunisphaera limnophila TaxID=1838286 RepID=A0A1D8AXR3_9BACT|nr:hypothetical protein [Lacunisphaera limnophila]AOS45667.1 hypothetical protein Verru16b_02752 [Lacunisphaera limnophila]
MNNPKSVRLAARSRALLVLSCATLLTLVAAPAVVAADAMTLQPLADKALPLSATFAKVEGTEGTPFVLTLKNDGHDALTVSGKVLLSVVHHAMDKARVLPEQTVAAGAVMTVKDLSGGDKVLLSAAGYAPLEVVVPFKL